MEWNFLPMALSLETTVREINELNPKRRNPLYITVVVQKRLNCYQMKCRGKEQSIKRNTLRDAFPGNDFLFDKGHLC